MHPDMFDTETGTFTHGGFCGLGPGPDHHRIDPAGDRLQVVEAPVAFDLVGVGVDREHLIAAGAQPLVDDLLPWFFGVRDTPVTAMRFLARNPTRPVSPAPSLLLQDRVAALSLPVLCCPWPHPCARAEGHQIPDTSRKRPHRRVGYGPAHPGSCPQVSQEAAHLNMPPGERAAQRLLQVLLALKPSAPLARP